MENSKSNMWIWGGVVLVVIAVVWYWAANNSSSTTTPTADNTTTTEPESTEDVGDTTSGVPPVSISYANALVKYADRRIQLDKICQATPDKVTYKDNTGIMIDNRSPSTRTVKVGTTFTIKPYGFKIVVLPDVYLKSSTLLVDCDKSQNVATVLVQE